MAAQATNGALPPAEAESGVGWSLRPDEAVEAGGGAFFLCEHLLTSFARVAAFLPLAEVQKLERAFIRAKVLLVKDDKVAQARHQVILQALALVRNVEQKRGIESALSRLHAALLTLGEVIEVPDGR